MADVLVLEDDPSLQFTFSEALKDAGHTVFAESQADKAIEQIRRRAPDILLLDLMVDGTYSTSVADYAAFAAPQAHVIYVTGSGLFPKGELFDMSTNTRWVLRKPVKIQELTDMVDHIAPVVAEALRRRG